MIVTRKVVCMREGDEFPPGWTFDRRLDSGPSFTGDRRLVGLMQLRPMTTAEIEQAHKLRRFAGWVRDGLAARMPGVDWQIRSVR